MRVLVVTNMYPSPARPALGSFVRDQVEALEALPGVEVELFAFEPRRARDYVAAAAALARTRRDAPVDVVHAHYGLSGWVALAVRGAPHVVTFHGTDLAHPVVGALSRLLAPRVELVAPVSASLARAGRLSAERIAVLPCGVNLERFTRIDRAQARRRLGLEPDGRYLLFPADPSRREKRFDRARAVANALRCDRLLSYDGAHPDEVPLLINAANAVVVTSSREGFGLAPLEALACDVPVVATHVGIAPVALSGIEGTLCAPFEVERWRAALEPHLEAGDPRVCGRLRAALFDRHRMAARVLAAYRDLQKPPL